MNPAQRRYLEALGYKAGDIVSTRADAEASQAEMVNTGLQQWKSFRAAKTGRPAAHKSSRRPRP